MQNYSFSCVVQTAKECDVIEVTWTQFCVCVALSFLPQDKWGFE